MLHDHTDELLPELRSEGDRMSELKLTIDDLPAHSVVMKEFDKEEYIEQGGLYVDDGCIWYEGIKYLPERTCGEWRGSPGSVWEEDSLELWCEHCDREIDPDWSYCPFCGAKVVEEEQSYPSWWRAGARTHGASATVAPITLGR